MSYSAHYSDTLRMAAGYVDRILKGANLSEPPIEQPTRFQMLVNLKPPAHSIWHCRRAFLRPPTR